MAKKIVFLLLSIILGCLLPGQAAPTTRIRLSQSNVGLTAAPLWVATRHESSFTRELKKKGFRVLAELSSANIPFASSGLVVSQAYLKKEGDAVENVLKALIEATAFLYKPVNRQLVLGILTDRLKLSDTTSAEEARRDFEKLVAKRPYPDVDGLRNIQRVMKSNPSVARMKVENVIDGRIYRKLEESQFIDRLYN